MNAVAQFPRLLKLALRRDRVSLPIWIVAVVGFCIIFVPAFPNIVGTGEEIAVLAEMMKNPAMIAMVGISYGQTYTIAIMYVQMMMVWSALIVAVMNILIVIRHTRADEDEGRLEVIRSLPVGRLANLQSVAVLMLAVNLVVALLLGFGMAAFGVESIDLAGSMVYGFALGACGLFFAAMTMLIVQITQSARGATGLSFLLLGLFYLLRAYGDISAEWASRLSPLGLIQRTFPYDTNQWWPILALVIASVVLVLSAFALNALRDLGQGLLPQRGGRSHASRILSGEWGLAWRLNRTTIIAWAVTIFVFSAAYGSVMNDMESFVNSSELYQQLMGVTDGSADLVGPVASMLVLIMTMLGAIPVLTTAHKLVSEEKKGRLDPILGKAVSRTRLYAGYALLVVIVSVAMQILTALGFWSVAASVMDDPIKASLVFKVAFNYLPALLALGALGLCLVGWAKKHTWISWAYLVVSFLLVYVGGILDTPRWLLRLTPFGLIQRWPTEAFSWWPWLGLLLIAAVLGALAAVGFRRRDITA